MPQDALQLWFRASQFEIEPGEDEETNPLCYGRQLALWLRSRLIAQGYAVEDVISEDWGWCVMCQRKPFSLWVGCVSVHDYAKSRPEDPPPQGKDVLWTCFIVAEHSLVSRLFGRPDTTAATAQLHSQVKRLLEAEPDIVFTNAP